VCAAVVSGCTGHHPESAHPTPAPSNTSAAAVRAGLDCDNHLAIFVNSEANTVQGVTEVGPRPSSGWPGHLGPYGRTTPDRSPRLGKPVELGYKAQVTENGDGVIVDHAVERGNPPTARSSPRLSTWSSSAPAGNPGP
jgi:hypothetical protein